MKQVGKIVVFLISFYVIFTIYTDITKIWLPQFFTNEDSQGLGILKLLFIAGISLFITYSKWANNNIWNRKTSKPVETIKPKPKSKLGKFILKHKVGLLLITFTSILYSIWENDFPYGILVLFVIMFSFLFLISSFGKDARVFRIGAIIILILYFWFYIRTDIMLDSEWYKSLQD